MTNSRAHPDAREARPIYEPMQPLAYSLGIPFSFAALITGVLLALASRRGLLRTWWVTAKPALLTADVLAVFTPCGPIRLWSRAA